MHRVRVALVHPRLTAQRPQMIHRLFSIGQRALEKNLLIIEFNTIPIKSYLFRYIIQVILPTFRSL